MKRLLSLLMCAIIVVSIFPVVGSASVQEQTTIYYADGSYMTVEVDVCKTRASGNVTSSKKYTYYDDNNVSQWKAVLSGTFTYTGSSATCTASSVDVTIYDSAWYVSSKYASKSGNTAEASVTMGHKVAGITITKVPVDLTLTCDANGNLS